MIKLFIPALFLLSTTVFARPGSEISDTCDSCQQLVNFVERVSSSDVDIEDALTDWCQNSGYGATRKVCEPMVRDGLNIIRFSGIATAKFCEVFKVCPSDEDFELPHSANDTNCDFCVNVMNHVKEIVSSRQTENELKSQIAQACGFLGSFRDECTQLVDKNIDDWFDYLRTQMDPKQVCQRIGFCLQLPKQKLPQLSEIVNILPAGLEVSSNDDGVIPFTHIQRTAVAVEEVSIKPECIMCEQVTKMLVKKLKDNRTRDAIIKELDEVCERLIPKDQQPECESLVNQYTEEMINLLLAETNPKVICKLLGVCTSTSPSSTSGEQGKGEGEEIVESKEREDQEETSGDEGMFCGSCLLAREWISLQVEGNQSREALESALNQVCYSILKRVHQEDCKEFVTRRVDYIYVLFLTEPDPKVFCSKLELCGQSRSIETSPIADGLEREVDNDAKRKTVFPECYICKQVMHWLNTQLKDNRTEEAISSALQRVCSIFGHKIKNCNEQIEEYTERLIQVLKTATSADIGCVILGECTAVNTNTVESKPKERSGEACFECESIAHFIQNELYDFNKEKQIDDWITQTLCDKVNNVLAKETCQSFIQEYGPSILELIAQRTFDPNTLCKQTLKLCPTVNSPIIVPEFELTHARGGACDLCIDTVERLDAYLTSEDTDKEIVEVAAQVCDEFEGHKKDQCVTIITVYGPYFIQMIGRLSDPRKVCKSVDLCQIAGQVHMLGGHKCTFGPTYWCHTSASAQACQATDYCVKSVWKPINN